MRSLWRIAQTALCEWENALRSRRALVLLLLYLAAAVLCMNGTISVLGKMETELVRVLRLPDSGQAGVVSETLWKSKSFRNMIAAGVDDRLVFEDISKRHPVELLYAWFAFFCAPLLVVLVSGTRVAEDLRTGVARYMLVRTSRLEWSLGKYAGQALMIACALAVSAVGAWCVALYRLPAATACRLFLPMLGWGASAWFYSLAWLGLALGLSHLTRRHGVRHPGNRCVRGAAAFLPRSRGDPALRRAVGSVADLLHAAGRRGVSPCDARARVFHGRGRRFCQEGRMTGFALETRNLVKRYGRRRVLDGFTLAVPRGAVLGLVGANGAGKTTWMMTVAGLLRPASGTIDILGGGPFDAAIHAGRLALLPQDSELPLEATPTGLFYRFGRLQGLSAETARRSAAEVLKAVNLADRAKSSIRSAHSGDTAPWVSRISCGTPSTSRFTSFA